MIPNNSEISHLSALLRDKKISSVELCQHYLARITANERLNAFITVDEDGALENARISDQKRSRGHDACLLGIPIAHKDIFCTDGVLTTCGSRILENFVAPYDATVVAALKAAGAVLLGKTNMDEFAMGSSTENSAFFPTHNPWSLDRVPGGSSGGPAAAVAAGECLYSLGSDTGGSIRQPASLCGVVGLKPTYGLVSRCGLVAFASSLDQIGPITMDVADCAHVLNAIAGHDPMDSTSLDVDVPDYTASLGRDLTGLRIGVPREYFVEGMEPSVEASTRRSIALLEELGAEVAETSLPHTAYALSVYYILAPSECSANLARYDGVKYGFSDQDSDSMWDALEQTRGHGFGPEVKRRIMLGTYALSAGYYDAFYLKAQQVRTIIRREFETEFEKFDAIVSATSPTVAFKLGEKTSDPLQMYLSDVLTLPANIAGIPGISVPAGLSDDGLPIGFQILTRHLGEPTLFRIAHAFEQACGWNGKRPPLDL